MPFGAATTAWGLCGCARATSSGSSSESSLRAAEETLIVYPRTYDLDDLGLQSARPFGERRGGPRIFPDPVRVVGVRDYVPGDPLKQIDWAATARAGRLQSRLYEPSRAHAVVVALDVTTLEHTWEGTDPVLLERAVTVAASVARDAFEQKAAVGLITNGALPEGDRAIRLGAGRRPDQLARVLEALAGVNPFAMARLADELEQPGQALSLGATLVVVAAQMPAELAATLQRLRAEGHTIHVVKTSDRVWTQSIEPIPVTDISERMEYLEAQAEREDASTRGAPRPSRRRPRERSSREGASAGHERHELAPAALGLPLRACGGAALVHRAAFLRHGA